MALRSQKIKLVRKFLQIPVHPMQDEISIHCPFHDDADKSASFNVTRNVMNCHGACGRGYNLEQIYKKAMQDGKRPRKKTNTKTTKKISRPRTISKKTKSTSSKRQKNDFDRYARSRGFTQSNLTWAIDDDEPVNRVVVEDALQKTYQSVRTFPPKDRKVIKYKNIGKKNPFFTSYNEKDNLVFITEGLFDSMSISALGKTSCCTLGTKISATAVQFLAYYLRNKIGIIVFDDDPAGFSGAKKLAAALKAEKADTRLTSFPKKFIGREWDPNTFFVEEPEAFSTFIEDLCTKYNTFNRDIVQTYFSETTKSLNKLTTPNKTLNKILPLSEGVHVFSGETGSCKSSLMNGIVAHNCIKNNKRILDVTTELSVRQKWARYASQMDQKVWSAIEEHPNKIHRDTRRYIEKLSENLTIVKTMSVERAVHMLDDYDCLLIDYIQRMSGIGGDEDTSQLSQAMTMLTEAAVHSGKVILVVSSIARSAYDDDTAFGLKGSGDIEFKAASVSRVINPPVPDKLILQIQKNTRRHPKNASEVRFGFAFDKGHQKFLTGKLS